MSRPTILLCGPPLTALGGGPTHMNNLLASPLAERYRIVVFPTGSRGTESPAKDESFLAKWTRLIAGPFALAWRIVGERPAVVHLNSALTAKGFWRDFGNLLVCRLLGRRAILQLHGGSLTELCGTSWMRGMVRFAFSLPDAIVLLASVELKEFGEFGMAKRAVVIPNGIDVAAYRTTPPRVHRGQVVRLAYVGRLIRSKGVFEAIAAVELVRAQGALPGLELHVAGTGPDREEMQRDIDARGLGDAVKLVGSVFGSDKVTFLTDADVFVFPTYHREGLPYSILESLAAGTPVVATAAGGIPDVVTDGVHGRLVEPHSPAAIAAALGEMVASADALRAMSRACRERAEKDFGLERLARDFTTLYERVGGR